MRNVNWTIFSSKKYQIHYDLTYLIEMHKNSSNRKYLAKIRQIASIQQKSRQITRLQNSEKLTSDKLQEKTQKQWNFAATQSQGPFVLVRRPFSISSWRTEAPSSKSYQGKVFQGNGFPRNTIIQKTIFDLNWIHMELMEFLLIGAVQFQLF